MSGTGAASKSNRRTGHRPGKFSVILVGVAASILSLFLEHRGVSWKYSDTGFGTILLVWCLLSIFRPEWHRPRFWTVMAAITIVHLAGWVYLANRIERFGFGWMFLLVIVELMVGGSVVLKAIPEDYAIMVDYIHRW